MTGIDVSTLTRLANEMFSALSSSEGAPSTVSSVEGLGSNISGLSALSAVPTQVTTSGGPSRAAYPSSFGVPGDAEIRDLLRPQGAPSQIASQLPYAET